MLSAGGVARSVKVVTLVGLALRLAWWWHAHPDPVSDFEYYRRMAADLLDHHALGYPKPSAARVPAYPLFLAAAMLVSRAAAWLSLVNVLLSALLVPIVARIARALELAPGVSLCAASLVAIDPTFVFFSPVLASEHLYVVLLFGSMLMAIGARARLGLAMAGLLLGAAALTRPDALFYLPVIAGVAWLRSGRVRPVAPAIVLMTFALIVSPWYLRNRAVLGPGAGLSTVGGLNFYYAHNDEVYGWQPLDETPLTVDQFDEVALQTHGYALGFDYLSHAGARRVARDIWIGTERLYSPTVWPFALYWSTLQAGSTPDNSTPNALHDIPVLQWLAFLYVVVLCGAGVSVVFIARYPPMASIVLYGALAVGWIGHCWIFWADPRYRYVSEVIFCVLTAMAVMPGQALRRRGFPRFRE